MSLRACKECHLLAEQNNCPECNSETSREWQGFIIILDPEHSKAAKRLDIRKKGMYALRVR